MRRRLIRASLVAAVAMTGGCQGQGWDWGGWWPSQKNTTSKNQPVVASSAPLAAATQPVVEGGPTPEAIAAYAQSVEAALARRARATTAPSHDSAAIEASAPTQPSTQATATKPVAAEPQVVWLDPGQFTLSPLGTAAATTKPAHPATAPAAAATPEDAPAAANQVVAVPEDRKPATQPVATQPTTGPATSPSMADLERRLAQFVKDEPRNLQGQLDYQLLQLLLDRQVPQMETISPLGDEDRETLAALMDGLSNFRNRIRNSPNGTTTGKLQPLLEMGERLRAKSDLAIPTAMLCTRVDGYGSYEPIDPPRFPQGSEHMAIIYCEVANFQSKPAGGKGTWETKLTQDAVLYTESGVKVWQDKSKPIVDYCRNLRHDFFIVKMMRLPKDLAAGKYLLKITVVDQQAGRVAETTVPLEIY